MRLVRTFLISVLALAGANAAHAAGQLDCVVYDRALRMTINATYFYGVSDRLATLEGRADILWDATPKPLKSFDFNQMIINRIQIANDDLILDLTKVVTDGRRTVQAQLMLTGKRVVKDPTTFRAKYLLSIGRIMPVTTASKASNPLASAPTIKPLHAATGHAECTAR
jgi:hypothetical protein